MNTNLGRRGLLKAAAAGSVLASAGAAVQAGLLRAPEKKFRISLAEWSLHRAIRARLISNLEFPRIAREHFGIEGLEFSNTLWEAPTADYVQRLKANMADTGTKGVLIMVDGEGPMADAAKSQRMRAADNHRKWVDIAAELGCHSVRTNLRGGQKVPMAPGEIDELIKYCSESFGSLCEYARGRGIHVIIENHGGISSDPDLVARVLRALKIANLGTLPDFGNFPKEVDRYEAVRKLMPFAKGVSMKCYDFTAGARETTIDMDRMLKVVYDSGYRNWLGIEYEGNRLTEFEGIHAAKRCLERILG